MIEDDDYLMTKTDLRVFSTAAHVIEGLRERFNKPDYAFFPQVRDKAGFSAERTADAMAMGLWKTRGYELHGFEVKVSRGDWLRELKEPEKCEALCKYCDRWWIAVSDAAIVKKGELPSTWGLLAPRAGKIAIYTHAPKLDPLPMTKEFLAALMKRVMEHVVDEGQAAAIRDSVYRERDQAWEKKIKEYYVLKRDVNNFSMEEFEKLKRNIDEFESRSGISIRYAWQHGGAGDAVRALLNGGCRGHQSELERFIDRLTHYIDDSKKAVEQMKQFNERKIKLDSKSDGTEA